MNTPRTPVYDWLAAAEHDAMLHYRPLDLPSVPSEAEAEHERMLDQRYPLPYDGEPIRVEDFVPPLPAGFEPEEAPF